MDKPSEDSDGKVQHEVSNEDISNSLCVSSTDKEDGESQPVGNKEDAGTTGSAITERDSDVPAVGAECVNIEGSPDERDREGQAAVSQEGGKSEDGSKDSKKDNAEQAGKKVDGAEANPKGDGYGEPALKKAVDLATQATEADNSKNYEEALQLYSRAIDCFLHAMKYEAKGAKAVEAVKAKCDQYIDRSDQLRKHLSRTTSVQKAIDLATQATKADNAEKYEEALQLYLHAIDYFLHALKYELRDGKVADSVRTKCGQYIGRAEQIKKTLVKMGKIPQRQAGGRLQFRQGGAAIMPINPRVASSSEDTEMTKFCNDILLRDKPNVRWDNIAGLHVAKESLKESVILPVKFPHLFKGKRAIQRPGTLLYGPPGTGKSYLAKAVATEADSTFFSISSSDLFSKKFGW